MTTEQLRNSILQEAISGRLVPQDPNDEPASALLARIREEKERLLKKKKISKNDYNVLPIAENDIDFEIPATWEWVRLGEIFKHSTGKALNEANRKGSLHDYITTSNVYWGFFKLDKLRQMYYTEDEKEKCMATKGDLLVLEGGDVGRAAIWDKDYDIYLQNHIHKLRAYLPVCTKFYYYCLYYLHDTQSVSGKGIGIQGLSSKALHNILFPLPPLAEQQRIVAKLEELLPIVEQYGKAQTELDELNAALPSRLRQSVLQEAIQGKLVPQDPNDEPASSMLEKVSISRDALVKEKKVKGKDIASAPITEEEKPFDLPNRWEFVRLNYVAMIARGGSPRPIKDYLTESPNGLNWIKIGDTEKGGKYINQTKERIKPEGLKKSRLIHKGDFLLTNSMSFGRPYISNIEGCIHDGWLVISPAFGEVFDKNFLYYVLSSPYARDQFLGKVSGAVVQNLNSDKVAESIFPLPPLAEQQRIVAKIEELFAEIDRLQK